MKVEDKTEDGEPIYRCYDNDHWTEPNTDLQRCKERCKGYLYMTFVARGDRNCACQNWCRKVSRDKNCDLYQSGKVFLIFKFQKLHGEIITLRLSPNSHSSIF